MKFKRKKAASRLTSDGFLILFQFVIMAILPIHHPHQE